MSEERDSILLCAAGDVALGGSLEGRLETAEDRAGLIAGVRTLFAEGDICFLNLDCTFDTSGVPPQPDEYLVAASPGQLGLLGDLGIDVVSLANNHSLDYGGDSLELTREHLRRRGMETVGAGRNLVDARGGVVRNLHGLRIGFLAYASSHLWVGAIPAGSNSPGVAPIDADVVREDVRRLREEVDCLVVSMHWGKEYMRFPPPENIQLAHQLVDQGVDLILGHHPHVIQGMEQRGRGLIFYSLGNFLFPDYGDQGLGFGDVQRESLVAQVRLSAEGAAVEKLEMVCMGEDGTLGRLTGERGEAARRELEGFSGKFQDDNYGAFWQSQVRDYELRRLWRVFKEEVVEAGWRGGMSRLWGLGRKNINSIGRSFAEILGGEGKSKAKL